MYDIPITTTTEYDLTNMLSNKNASYQIDRIMIERTKNYAMFVLNHTGSILNASNMSSSYPQTYNKIYFNSATSSKIIDRYDHYNGSKIKITYFDEPVPFYSKLDTFVNDVMYDTLYSAAKIILVCTILSTVLCGHICKQSKDNSTKDNLFKDIQSNNKQSDTQSDKQSDKQSDNNSYFKKLFGVSDTEDEMKDTIVKNPNVLFSDVIGMTEAKQQLEKYVDTMKNRQKYINIGAHISRGILLCGPPGCGKTLLAKAVAGEAKTTFISVCGSDFDKIYIGAGSARVAKLFALARKNTPCTIFIDEIDSIGANRDGKMSGNRESGVTLNKILAEMDGFKNNEEIMVIAATNRPEILDPALTRSGRFDSKIYIDPPSKTERADMFRYYLNKITVDHTLDCGRLSTKLANITPGATGADISNICNQAAISAANISSGSFETARVKEFDLVGAIDDVMIGIEKKSKKVDRDETLKIVAYHESGHALMGYLLADGSSPTKLSVVPRGHGNLGYTLPHDSENEIKSKEQYMADVYSLFGGRAAEMITFNKVTSGASNDLEKATKIVETMATKLGMYEQFAPMTYETDRTVSTYVSEQKRKEIEDLVQLEMQEMYTDTVDILKDHKNELSILAENLLTNEVMVYDQIKTLFPNIENSVDITQRRHKRPFNSTATSIDTDVEQCRKRCKVHCVST